MSWTKYHALSEQRASDAEIVLRSGATELALSMYAQAADLESRALDELEKSKSRTRGITVVSAVALWYKAREYRRALDLANRAVGDTSLPPFAVSQLNELLAALSQKTPVPTLRLVASQRLSRHIVILAPAGRIPRNLESASYAGSLSYQALLAGMQKLRGTAYLKEGVLGEHDLTSDGRYIAQFDAASWHILIVHQQEVIGSISYEPISKVSTSHLPPGQSAEWSAMARLVVEEQIDHTHRTGLPFVVVRDWVMVEDLRCSTEAIRLLLVVFALARYLGGASGLAIASSRHSVAAIFRRVGFSTFIAIDSEVARVFDPKLRCEVELLRFHSELLNPRYLGWVREFERAIIASIPVISAFETGGEVYVAKEIELKDPRGTIEHLSGGMSRRLWIA
jgi:hypothetical protein